jgi:hypothetical protein
MSIAVAPRVERELKRNFRDAMLWQGRAGMTDEGLLALSGATLLDALVEEDVDAMLFTSDDAALGGARYIGRLSGVAELRARFALTRGTPGGLTAMLNRMERALPTLTTLRAALIPGFAWLRLGTYAIVSTAGSGVGYHADQPTVLIAQLAGRKHWRVWEPAALPDEYRRALSRGRLRANARATAVPTREPIFEAVLEPGDLLLVPPFFGHQAVAVGPDDAVSVSMLWANWTPRLLLPNLVGVDGSVFEGELAPLADVPLGLPVDDPLLHYASVLEPLTERLGIPLGLLASCIADRLAAGTAT